MAGDPLTRQILRALRASAPILAGDPPQVRSELADRLEGQPDPGITGWAAGLTRPADGPDANPSPLTLAPSIVPVEQVLATLTDPVRAVAVTPGGLSVISGGDDGAVRVWELDKGREQAALTGHTDWVRAVAVIPDGTRAVTASDDGSVRIWDLDTEEEQATLSGHTGEVFSVAVTPDGTRAVSGSSDSTIRVWDLATGLGLATLTGHGRPVLAVGISPDGLLAASGGEDMQVRVWDLAAGTEVARWPGDHPIVGCAALPGRPVKIGVGQKQGPPYLLELRKTSRRRESEQDQRGPQPKAGSRRQAGGNGPAAAPAGTGVGARYEARSLRPLVRFGLDHNVRQCHAAAARGSAGMPGAGVRRAAGRDGSREGGGDQ